MTLPHTLMSAYRCVCFAAGLTLMNPLSATSAEPLHILPLGDSITQGGRSGRDEFSYRLPLFQLLTDAGVSFDFVGAQRGGLNADFTWPDYKGIPFDPDHEGHYGWKTAAVFDALPEWMPKWSAAPDIVLIHLGTNDMSSPDFARDIVAPLEGMIKLLREKNPRVVVLLGQLSFNGGSALEIRPLVEALAQRLDTPESPVRTVAHYEGWVENSDLPDADTFDWAHPNPQGQRKMAERWIEAMRPFVEALSKKSEK